MKIKYLIALLLAAGITANVFADKPPPKPSTPSLNARVNSLESASRHMVIVDANGILIGDGQEMSVDGKVGGRTIYFENGQQIYWAELSGNEFDGRETFYTLSDCKGDAYTTVDFNDIDNFDFVFAIPSIDPNALYRRTGDPTSPLTTVVSQMFLGPFCENISPEDRRVSIPMPVIDLTQYVKPYKIVLRP